MTLRRKRVADMLPKIFFAGSGFITMPLAVPAVAQSPVCDDDTETPPATPLEIEFSNYPNVTNLRGKHFISRDICVFVRDLQYDNISGRYQFVTELPDCAVLPKILP